MNPQALENLREGKAECPSDLQLDRLHAGELGTEVVARLQAHIAGCEVCPARMEARRSGFDQFPAVDPRPLLAGIHRGLHEQEQQAERSLSGRWLRRLGFVVAPVAAAAAALGIAMFLGRPDPSGDPGGDPQGTRFKGGLALHVFRQRAEPTEPARSEQMMSGERFKAGDRIRFTVDLPHAGVIIILGIEADGDLYVAWPDPAAGAEPAVTALTRPAGSGQELPGAVSLDASPGRETLYLVHCPDAQVVPRCTTQGATERPLCPKGCSLAPFVINKEP